MQNEYIPHTLETGILTNKTIYIQFLHCCEMCEDVIGDDRNIIMAEIQFNNAPVVDCEGSRRNAVYGIMG